MAAEIGNNYAEKWTIETVNDLLDRLLIYAKDCKFLGKVLCDNNLSRQTWDYIQDKFKEDRNVLDMVKKIESLTETNLVNAMLNGDTKETASIFLLKCKYGYQDKQVVEVEHKGSINVNFNLNEADNSDM